MIADLFLQFAPFFKMYAQVNQHFPYDRLACAKALTRCHVTWYHTSLSRCVPQYVNNYEGAARYLERLVTDNKYEKFRSWLEV